MNPVRAIVHTLYGLACPLSYCPIVVSTISLAAGKQVLVVDLSLLNAGGTQYVCAAGGEVAYPAAIGQPSFRNALTEQRCCLRKKEFEPTTVNTLPVVGQVRRNPYRTS